VVQAGVGHVDQHTLMALADLPGAKRGEQALSVLSHLRREGVGLGEAELLNRVAEDIREVVHVTDGRLRHGAHGLHHGDARAFKHRHRVAVELQRLVLLSSKSWPKPSSSRAGSRWAWAS
jgi:hypothetical protein